MKEEIKKELIAAMEPVKKAAPAASKKKDATKTEFHSKKVRSIPLCCQVARLPSIVQSSGKGGTIQAPVGHHEVH